MAGQLPILPMDVLVNEGYMQEANRRFFHPLGLALVVQEQPGGGMILGLLDGRHDPEGFFFDFRNNEECTSFRMKAAHIAGIESRRKVEREQVLGFWIQPTAT